MVDNLILHHETETPVHEPNGGRLIASTSHAGIYEFEVYDAWGKQTSKQLAATDETGSLGFEGDSQLEEFMRLDTSVQEFIDFEDRRELVNDLQKMLPEGELNRGTAEALLVVTKRLQDYVNAQEKDTALSSKELENLKRSRRDFLFALKGIIMSLGISSPGDLDLFSPLYADTHRWYEGGRKSRNSGYIAEYTVCNDTFGADDEDHEDVLHSLKQDSEKYGGDELWPDEFHHPAKLEIRVDPAKRIEFVYTPEIVSAKMRHQSQSEVRHEGVTKRYENTSLSIRLDLDPTAPYGIALDVGRSAYDGERDGRHTTRNSDLLGEVLAKTSETGSHEYEGFTPDMAEEFRNFAERFAVQLDLQNKEHQGAILKRQKLAEGTLRVVS